MQTYILIFIAGFFILLTSLSGKLMMWGTLGDFLQRNIKFLVTFALGIFSATFILMFSEAREYNAPIVHVALVAGLGAIILELLQKAIPDAHHHHGANKDECCEQFNRSNQLNKPINPKRILIGDAFHNIGDGLALVPAFLISPNAGLALAFGVFLHEFVQETSEFFLLKEAGYSTRRALLSNFVVQSSIFIGIIIAIIIVKTTHIAPYLIALSLGMLLYIILRDLLPHTIEQVRHNGKFLTHIILFFVGLILLLGLSHILPG